MNPSLYLSSYIIYQFDRIEFVATGNHDIKLAMKGPNMMVDKRAEVEHGGKTIERFYDEVVRAIFGLDRGYVPE